MDRRSFLTLLGAVGVSVVMPDIWTPPPALPTAAKSIREVCRVSAPADHIFDIMLCGHNNFSEVAHFNVFGANGEKLLAIRLNTFGGLCRWVAAPGEELPAPLRFEYAGNMTVNVVGKRGDLVSWTVIEPPEAEDDNDQETLLAPPPVIIPVSPTWEKHPALEPTRVPNIFLNAWGRGGNG